MSTIRTIVFYYRLLFLALAGIICSCHAKPEQGNAVAVTTSDSVEKSVDTVAVQQEVFPPEEFIKDLKTQATDIALVRLTRVDSVYGATKVFGIKVIKVYKGKLNNNETASYAGMSEKIYPKPPSDTLVVFLVKHKKPLMNLNVPNVYYSSVEENAAIKPSPLLDSLLKKI